jgi:hypothetical protein
MMDFKWIECDDFEISMMEMPLKNGGGTVPLFVFVASKPADKVQQLAFKNVGFKEFATGVWITNQFINVAERKLNMRDLIKFLQDQNFKPKVSLTSREKIQSTLQGGLSRSKALAQQKRNSFSQIESTYLGLNADEEDVYSSENRERFVRDGQQIIYLKDIDEPARFLVAGQVSNNQITLDTDTARDYVINLMQTKTEGWTIEDSLGALSLLTDFEGDVFDLANVEPVINELHSKVNNQIQSSIKDAIRKDDDQVRNTRNAINQYANTLPLYDQGDEYFNSIDSPLLQMAMSTFEAAGVPVIRIEDNLSIPTLFTGTEEATMLVIKAPNVEIETQERDVIDSLQDEHSIMGMFEIAKVANTGIDMAHRLVLVKKDVGSRKPIPPTVKATRSITETMSIVEALLTAETPLPFSRDELSTAIEESEVQAIKTVPYESVASAGTEPNQYVVPAALQGPLLAAKMSLTERVGDIAQYVAAKLEMDIEDVDTVFSKAQIDTIALTIADHEAGGSNIMGNGTGTGKTRVIAAMLRYRALRNEPTFFATVDKELFNNLFHELRVIKSQHLINPLVASDESLIDEDEQLLILPDGGTSVDHLERFNELVKTEQPIPSNINLVMCSYYKFNNKPVMLDEDGNVPAKRTKKENLHRKFDSTTLVERFLARGDSLGIFDESHYASGSSNTGNNIKKLMAASTNVLYSSATYAKNFKKMGIYWRALPDGIGAGELEDMLSKGGLDVVEGFTMKMASTGRFTTYQMPTDDVKYISRTDDANLSRYKTQNNEFAAIITKMKDITEDINLALTSRKEGILQTIDKTVLDDGKRADLTKSFGFRVINSFSRFTKLNELKVMCEKAKFVSDLAIESLKNNQKPWIPTELTSETNIKYVSKLKEAPIFNEKDVTEGKHIEWLDALEQDGNTEGFSVTVGDALLRSLNQMLHVNVPVYSKNADGKFVKDKELVDARRFIEDELGQGKASDFLMKIVESEKMIADMTKVSASPIDEIKHAIKRAGFSVGEYSGRKLSIEEDSKGRRYLAKRNTLNSTVREDYQLGKTDAAIVTRSGFTGKEWHAEQGKDERQRVAYKTLPVTSSDLEKQLAGRLVRTGMAKPPIFVDVVTGLLPEKRLYMQADFRRRSLDAGTSADANYNYKDGEIYLFSDIGNDAATRYFLNNPDYFNVVGMTNEDVERSYGNQSSFAMTVTARLQLLDCDTGEDIMRGIEREYYRVIEEMEENGIKPFGDQTLYWDANIKDKILISGDENTVDPWNAAVYAAKLTYIANDPVYSSSDVASAVVSAKKGHLKRTVDLANGGKQSLTNKAGELVGAAAAALEFADRSNYYGRLMNDGADSYYTNREASFRQMHEFLEGASIGDVILFTDFDDTQLKGVIVGANAEVKDTNVSIKVMVPGEAIQISINSTNIGKKNPVIAGMKFDSKSQLAKQFDNATQTKTHSRMVFMGDSFLMQKEGMQGKSSYLNGFSPRIMSVTTMQDDKKQLEKVVLLPKSISMHDVISRPIPLSSTQAYHYVKSLQEQKGLPVLDSSRDYTRSKDVRLSALGEKDNKKVYKLTVGRKPNSSIINDNNIRALDVNGEAFSEKPGSVAVTIFVEERNLPTLLESIDEHGVRLLSQAYGGQWVEEFKQGNAPVNYADWLNEQKTQGLELFKTSIPSTSNNLPSATI